VTLRRLVLPGPVIAPHPDAVRRSTVKSTMERSVCVPATIGSPFAPGARYAAVAGACAEACAGCRNPDFRERKKALRRDLKTKPLGPDGPKSPLRGAIEGRSAALHSLLPIIMLLRVEL
jgi:hypothetical protein